MIFSVDELYDLYEGGEKVATNEKFFRRLFEEDYNEYKERHKWASYPNYQKKIINTLISYVFYGQVGITKSEPLALEPLARELAKHAAIGGEAYAFEAEGTIDVYDRRQVIYDNGIYVIGSGDRQVKIDTINRTITGRSVNSTEPVTEELEDGRFVICRFNDDGESVIQDTAMMNILMYNYRSILDSHFNRSLWYMLYGPGLRQGKSKPAPRSYIPVSKDEVPPGVVTIDSPMVERIRQEIKDLKHDMAVSVGLEQEFADEIKVESGAALEMRMLDTNAVISGAAYRIQSAVNTISAYHARKYKHEPQIITLNPLLKMTSQSDNQQKYKFLIEFCGTEKVAKAVQIAALKAGLSEEMSDQEMDSLVKDIQANGGRKLFESGQFIGHF
jgi:hypothetical protein